jgi:Trk-type K+ transport system membrane component
MAAPAWQPDLPAAEQRLLNAPATLDRELLAWLLLGLFALFVGTFVVLRIPGSEQNNALTFDRAAFASMSAVTLTGLPQDVSISPFVGQTQYVPLMLLATTLASAFLTLVAAGLPACRVLGLSYSGRRIALGAAALLLGGTLIGGTALTLAGRPAVEGYLLAASAIGNSGITWGPLPRSDGWAAHACLFPLAFIGGLGLPVLLDCFDRIVGRTRELLPHTRAVLLLAIGLYVGGTLLLLASNKDFWTRLTSVLSPRLPGGAEAYGTWAAEQWRTIRSLVVDSAAFSADSRSAGFAMANTSVGMLPRAAQWIVLLLMAIGAAPASTGGGIKTTTLWALWRGLRQGLRGERLPPAAGFAVAWLFAFVLLVVAGTGIILATSPTITGDRPLFLAVSAVSNSGLSHDALAIVGMPLLWLIPLMALGRVVPIILAWLMAERIDVAETTVG